MMEDEDVAMPEVPMLEHIENVENLGLSIEHKNQPGYYFEGHDEVTSMNKMTERIKYALVGFEAKAEVLIRQN